MFKTIKENSLAEIVEKKSKFIASIFYVESREEALKKALELIPEGSSVGWGGALSAEQIGLMEALHACPVHRCDTDGKIALHDLLGGLGNDFYRSLYHDLTAHIIDGAKQQC